LIPRLPPTIFLPPFDFNSQFPCPQLNPHKHLALHKIPIRRHALPRPCRIHQRKIVPVKQLSLPPFISAPSHHHQDHNVRKRRERQLTVDSTFRSSNSARFLPRHWYLPDPNSRSADRFMRTRSWSLESSQRSGRYRSASAPKTDLLRRTPQAQVAILVPPGMKRPSMVSPLGDRYQ